MCGVFGLFVKSVMKNLSECIYVDINDSVKAALEKLENNAIDAVPVLDNGKYEGIVTRASIYEGFFDFSGNKEDFLNDKKVSEVSILRDLFVTESGVFEHVLVKLKDSPIVAVVGENNRFKGIVTRFDALEQFQSAFGTKKKGIRIAFSSVETEGRIAKLAKITQQFHENIISLATFDETDKLVRRIVMKVEKSENIDKFVEKLEESGFRILDIVED